MSTVTDTVVFDLSHPKALDVFKGMFAENPAFSVDEETLTGKASGHFYQVFDPLALNRGQPNPIAKFNSNYVDILTTLHQIDFPAAVSIPEGTRFKFVDPILEQMCELNLFENPATQANIADYLINGIPVNLFSTIEMFFAQFTMTEVARYLKLSFYPTGDVNDRRFNLGIQTTKFVPSGMFSKYKERDLGVRISICDVMWAINNQDPTSLNGTLTHLFNLLICQNNKSEEEVEKLRVSGDLIYRLAVPFYGLCVLPGKAPAHALSLIKAYLNDELFKFFDKMSENGEVK